jgi:Major Facilitator Superfamily
MGSTAIPPRGDLATQPPQRSARRASTTSISPTLYGWVHNETACDYAKYGQTHSMMTIGASTDYGLTWKILGPIIKGADPPLPDKETGDSCMSSFARNAIVLGLLSAVGPFAIDMYLPAMPAIAADLKTTTAAIQLTLTVFFIAFGLCQIAYGPLSDRYGRKVPL